MGAGVDSPDDDIVIRAAFAAPSLPPAGTAAPAATGPGDADAPLAFETTAGDDATAVGTDAFECIGEASPLPCPWLLPSKRCECVLSVNHSPTR
jgi:hypothetical protein